MMANGLAKHLASVAALLAVFAANPAPARQETPAALRAEAWEAAQWAIASDAADALARVSARFAQGDDALGRLAEEREGLIERRDRLERELERLYASDDAEALAARGRTRAAWETAVARLRTVDADIETRFPAYSELTSPRALSIAETQALLGPDEGLLLVLVNPETLSELHGEEPGADMALYLARHGVQVEVVVERTRDTPGDALIALAHDTRAGLLVAGAYGHNRYREWALGGATRALLHRAPVPLLCAH